MMEKVTLREGETFQNAKERVSKEELDRVLLDPRSSVLEDHLKKLDDLREQGLFAARETRAEIDRLTAEHKMSIRRTKLNEKLAEKARERESKRQVVALKFVIKEDTVNLRTDTSKEIKRETKYIVRISDQFKEENYDLIRDYQDDLPLAVKGLDLLLAITPETLSKAEDELSQAKDLVDEARKESLKPNKDRTARLEAKVNLLNAQADVSYRSEELKALKKYQRGFEKLADYKGSKYYSTLVKLALDIYMFQARADIRRKSSLVKADRARIKGQYKLDSERLRVEADKRIEQIEKDPEFHSRIAELKNGLDAAKARQKAVRSEADSQADAAWDIAHAMYGDRLEQVRAERRETRAYLNEHLKAYIKEHKKDREAILSESEKVYRELALGGVREDALEASLKETSRRISATVRKARKPRADRDVVNYYQPEEVIKNPSLVDTSNMRLVIKGADKAVDVKAIEKRDSILRGVYLFFIYLFLVICAVTVLFPFYWMINTSLKSTNEIINSITPTFWPKTVMWSNYVDVFDRFDFGTYLMNTLIVGIFSTIGVLLTCILSAFAFARLNFRGRDTLFVVFLATMMIPGEMMVITNYLTVANFGWIGTNAGRWDAYMAMIFPFCVSVFYIYLLRQNFKQIPEELYLAAKVDGKSDWGFLWKVMVPLCRPTLITIGILELMGNWNAYVWPNLVATKPEFRLISNGLRESFTNASGVQDTGLQMAATVYVTLPLLIVFIIFRKYIMKGMGRAGIKG